MVVFYLFSWFPAERRRTEANSTLSCKEDVLQIKYRRPGPLISFFAHRIFHLSSSLWTWYQSDLCDFCFQWSSWKALHFVLFIFHPLVCSKMCNYKLQNLILTFGRAIKEASGCCRRNGPPSWKPSFFVPSLTMVSPSTSSRICLSWSPGGTAGRAPSSTESSPPSGKTPGTPKDSWHGNN